MNACTPVVLDDRSRFESKQHIPLGVSRGLWNVVVVWIPISSVMWAGIIYAAWWLFR